MELRNLKLNNSRRTFPYYLLLIIMISLIASMAKNNVIGRNNTIPWHITEDYIRTKKLTLGHPVIMGQKNFESISGFKNFEGASGKTAKKLKTLPGRTNIVLTFDKNFKAPGAIVCYSFEDGIKAAEKSPGSEEIFIFGGASIYKYALEHDLVDKMYLTVIDEDVEGNVFFPKYDKNQWEKLSEKKRVVRVNEREIRYTFNVYTKIINQKSSI